MDTLIGFSSGAPASALILMTIAVVSLVGLYKAPRLIERNLLRPFGLAQRRDYATLVTSGFIHADLAHLIFNCFRHPSSPSAIWRSAFLPAAQDSGA